jgi:hypothetical protein
MSQDQSTATYDEVGFDGLTVREAIASRTLLGLDRLMEALRLGRMSFEQVHEAITVLLDTTMPFCDPGSQVLLRGLEAELKRQLQSRREADQDIAIARGDLDADFGAYGT